VVDHYDLGEEWEIAMTSVADRILAIDDLGRPHCCDAILDQNYRSPLHERYRSTRPSPLASLLGPDFALVRAEFAELRPSALSRPRAELVRILVFMGGTDPPNETTKALEGIVRAAKPEFLVDVVIGNGNPHRRAVEAACAVLQHAVLHVQTSRMANLMAAADLAICAGGSATWERCVVGLPALVTILSDNQVPIAERVADAGAHRLLGWHNALTAIDYADALTRVDVAEISRMSEAAAGICDGRGAIRVAGYLEGGSARQCEIGNGLHA
jgi:UDP-2,4-diacetamido-2,4,6-trideoxy-beta-L-altropyranose hydrolase